MDTFFNRCIVRLSVRSELAWFDDYVLQSLHHLELASFSSTLT